MKHQERNAVQLSDRANTVTPSNLILVYLFVSRFLIALVCKPVEFYRPFHPCFPSNDRSQHWLMDVPGPEIPPPQETTKPLPATTSTVPSQLLPSRTRPAITQDLKVNLTLTQPKISSHSLACPSTSNTFVFFFYLRELLFGCTQQYS